MEGEAAESRILFAMYPHIYKLVPKSDVRTVVDLTQ